MKIGIFCSIIGMAAYFASPSAMAAAKKSSTKGTSVIQGGTNVRTRVDVSGLYDQACYDAYYGCMDQFCIMENSNGGSCACSDDNEKYEAQLAEIKETFDEADRISTVEVEKIEAGAKADIIFNGSRRYDENGNVIGVDERTEEDIKATERANRRNIKFNSVYDDDDDMDALEMIAGKKGNELFKLSEQICLDMVPESCEKDVQMLRQVYSRQITADCKAFANYVEEQQKEAQLAMVDADKAVRDALRQSFEDANEYDLGKCIVKFRECMTTDDACGENWENCVSTIASENMQNNKATSVADSTVETIETYDITASTMERLNAKRDICENILDKCMAVRNQV